MLSQDLLFRFVNFGERVADVRRRLARTVEERAEKEVAARVAEGLLERVRNFWQPVDLIDVFRGVAQYHLLR